MCNIRPDITFAIGQFSKQNSDPRMGQIKVTKKIVYYLKGIIYLRLVYKAQPKDKGETKTSIAPFSFGLVRYGDSSYVRDSENRKLVIEYCYFFNGVIISCCNKI